MVVKKEILSELKKYNKDLEKHIPGLDFTNLNKVMPESSSLNDESFSILATTLVDLRTEMALMRKNMATDVEGMVLNAISSQQNSFLEQANKLHSAVITDLKQNFSSYIQEMNSEISNLKKELITISSQNKIFDKKLSLFNNSITEFKEIANNFEINASNNKLLLNPINSKLIQIEGNFNEIKTNLIENNKLISNSSKNISRLKHSNHSNIEKNNNFGSGSELFNSLKSELMKENSQLHNDIDGLTSKLNNSLIPSKNQEISKKIIVLNNRSIQNKISKADYSPNIDKILKIDSKLSKLNSLR